MTIKEFKESIHVGDNILLTEYTQCSAFGDALVSNEIPEKLKGMRFVTYKDTTGFYMKGIKDETNRRGSFCEWPKASELSVEGDTFTIDNVWLKRTYQRFNN